MSDTGWKSPSTVVDDSSVGVDAWSNPSNAKIEDGNCATIGAMYSTFSYSHYLKSTNFGFNIPTGAIINGIEARIKRYCDYHYAYDQDVSIIFSDGSIGSEDKGKDDDWNGFLQYVNYGGSSDLWSKQWTSSDINNSNFGLAFYIRYNDDSNGEIGNMIYVDNIQIKVYYTELGPVVGQKYALPPFRRS